MERFSLQSVERLAQLQLKVGEVMRDEAKDIAEFERRSDSPPTMADVLRGMLLPETPSRVGEHLAESVMSLMRSLCQELGLEHSIRILEGFRPQTDRELALAYNSVVKEIDRNLYLFIPPNRRDYWESGNLISQQVNEHFRDVVPDELRDAGTAYACGLFTASVFHSMRAAERGLLVIADKLGVTVTGDEAMKNIVDGIQSKSKALDDAPRSPNKKSDSQFFCDVAIEGGLMKDAWRNYVAHAKANYSERQSLQVLDATCRLFEKVAQRFDQDGVPVPRP